MRVLVAGDFCPRNRVATLIEKGNYAYVFGEMRPILSQADYSIVNLECPVCSGREKPIDKIGPNLKCTEKGIEAIKWAGFDCVTLANNHFLDYGKDAVNYTLEILNNHRFDYVGGGRCLAEASQVKYVKIADKCLAIINCCEHEFSIASEDTPGSNPLNPISQYYTIREAKAKADKVIVIVHGGHEMFQIPSIRMVETYRFFIDAGADAVVNHHQHCFSGYEVYHGKPIFYGLGNFCFDNDDAHSGIWTEGFAVTIDFSDNAPSFALHPYQQCSVDAKIRLLPNDSFSERLARLNATIASPRSLRSSVEEYYTSTSHQYGAIFEPINNRFYLGAMRRGWLPSLISKKRKLLAANYILCEAHRDRLNYWLESI